MSGIFYYYKHQIMYNAVVLHIYIRKSSLLFCSLVARENCVAFDYQIIEFK